MLKGTALVLALGLVAGGCTHLPTQAGGQLISREALKSAQGYVVGTKEVTRDTATGEEITRISLFLPLLEDGRLVGYEERVPGGTVLHDLNGRRIGGRLVDLRSRSSNPHNRGVTIVVVPREDRVAAAPSIDELIRLARLDN